MAVNKPFQGQPYTVQFPIYAPGGQALLPGATGITSVVSQDGAAFAPSENSVVEIGQGIYSLTLNADETQGTELTVVVTSNGQPVTLFYNTIPPRVAPQPVTPAGWPSDPWEQKILRRLGLDPTEMSSDTMQDCISAALEEMSQNFSDEVYGLIPMQLNVQDYPFPEGVYRIKELYVGSGLQVGTLLADEDLAMMLQMQMLNLNVGGNPFENPSLAKILFSKLQDLREDFGIHWRVVGADENKVLRIIPCPTDDQTIAAYYGTTLWTLDDIPAERQELFLKAVLWKVCEVRSARLAVATSIHEASGNDISPAFEFWDNKAKAYKDEFLGAAGGKSMALAIG